MLRRFIDSAKEFYSLRDAIRIASSIADEPRKASERALSISRQRLEASETLWHAGFRAEGLRLALDAMRTAETAIPKAVVTLAGEEMTPDARTLVGFSAEEIKRIDATNERASKIEFPSLDAGIAKEHRDLHRELIATRQLIDVQLAPLVTTRWGRVATRARRVITTLGILALVIAGLVWAIAPKRAITVHASGHWDDQDHWHEDHIIDGVEATEWATPDGSAGFADLTLTPARNITGIEILNGHNTPWNDRATRAFRIEAYSHGRRVGAATGEFASYEIAPRWKRLALPANNVTRIRFQVVSWHQRGAALAEIRLLER
jgi:hypothetical protein